MRTNLRVIIFLRYKYLAAGVSPDSSDPPGRSDVLMGSYPVL
jgi:hypothetical protein